MAWKTISGNEGGAKLEDTSSFLHRLSTIKSGSDSHPEHAAARDLFDWDHSLTVARAPGRLDVMGGIADYSGSLVLQLPLAEACHVAVQRSNPGCVPTLRIVSLSADEHRSLTFVAPMDELFPSGLPLPYAEANAYFKRSSSTSWAAYIAGCLLVMAHEEGMQQGGGTILGEESVSILVQSDVPEGKGVSSSAALEVASMSALLAVYGTSRMDGRRLAIICQKVENLVVGAPCGIMDQMASALGESGQLLSLLCQPAEVQACVPIPPHIAFWGVDSGVRHSVGGSDYGSVRVGAFMGLAIASEVLPARVNGLNGGHLTNIGPSDYTERLAELLPSHISGAEFLQRYGPHRDSITSVDPGLTYAVRTPTAHPIYEHFRVNAFRAGLLAPEGTPGQMQVLGELMMQSHASYSACKLGSEGTDRLVQLVREDMATSASSGLEPSLFGAKITGGGCGGTVCIIGLAGDAGQAAVNRIVHKYGAEMKMASSPKIFSGSSVGATHFGSVTVQIL